MKKVVAVLGCLLLCWAGAVTARADYRDEMNSPEPRTGVSYQGLGEAEPARIQNLVQGWTGSGEADGTALSPQQNSLEEGRATYQVSGANAVEVCFYSQYSPLAGMDAQHGHYHPYLSAQGEGLPILVGPDGHAFIQDGETAYQLTYENNELCFQQIANLPPTLQPVYCRVYYSQDGSSYQLAEWKEISVLPLRDIQNINAVEGHYTRCRAQLPAGTGWVQVRVDQRLAPQPKPSYCLLASVKLEGNTVLGPVPVQPEPDPEEPQGSGGNRGSGGASDEKDEERMIRTIRPGSVIQAGGGAAAAAPKPLEESTNRVVEPIYPEQKEPAQETAQLDVPEDSWDEGYFYDEFGGADFPAEEEGGRSWLMGAAYLGVLAAVIGFLLLRRGSGRRKG